MRWRTPASSPSLKVKLTVRKRDSLGHAVARVPVVQVRSHGFLYTSALPPLLLQHLGQRLATEVPLILVRAARELGAA